MEDIPGSASEVLRALRAQRGLSQRALARLAGVDPATIGRIEAGRVSPGWNQVVRIIAAGSRGVALALPDAPADDELRDWLRRSTSERLFRSMGGRGHPLWDHRLAVWQELGRLATEYVVVLAPAACRGIWLPGVAAPTPLPVCVVARRTLPATTDLPGPVPVAAAAAALSATGLAVQHGPLSTAGLVPVGVTHRVDVLALPPSAPQLAADAVEAVRLRAATRLLHGEAERDAGQRRPPPHRASDPRREEALVMTLKRYRRAPRASPDPRERRDARLGGEASFESWLVRHGYPGTADG